MNVINVSWQLFQANLVLAVFLFFPLRELCEQREPRAGYIMDRSLECQSVTVENSHYANHLYAN